jgi:hypothetical protein
MRVVCTTMFSPSHQALADISVPNLREYCSIHGYEISLIEIENDKWEYKKHEAFKTMMGILDEGDVIWYKDVDSVITNMSVKITDFVQSEHHFFITRDFNELNGGSVIIKNTKVGRSFNDLILWQRKDFPNEQNAFNFWAKYLEPSLIKVLPHPSINSYDYSLYPECEKVRSIYQGHWREGDFVLHTPGLSFDKRVEVLKNAKITR